MDDVRTPIVWNKPKPRIYNYNQEITGCFYQVCYSKVLNTNNNKNIPLTFFSPCLTMLTQRKGRGFSSRNQLRKFTCQSPQSWPSWIIPSANSIKDLKLDSLTHFRGVRSCGSGERHSALIKGYSQMTKESNSMTGSEFKRYTLFASYLTIAFMLSVRTFNSFVRGSKDNTTLEAKLTSAMLRNAFRSINYPFPLGF